MRLIVESEPSASSSSRFFSGLSEQAETLAKSGKHLEIAPPKGKTLDRLRGSELKSGMVVCRGNVKEVGAPRGGTIFIEGDVEVLQGDFSGGIVYINGNLGKLINTDSTVLIVTGDVGEYRQSYRSGGGLSLPITHSPFLFSPKPIGGIMNVDGRATQIEPGMVVEKSFLENWTPENVVNKALELCRERISLENHRRMGEVMRISTASEMARFYNKEYQGFTNGYSRGYYDYPVPDSD